jgi:hypothetical protein
MSNINFSTKFPNPESLVTYINSGNQLSIIDKNSDTLLTSVIQAFNTIGETTNEKKLKKKLSESKYIKKYLTSQKEKYNEQVDILKEITSEKTRLTERHNKIKEEYPIISKDKSKKQQAIQLKEENSNILKIIKDLKEQEKKLKELIKSLEYFKTITTEEEMREYIKSKSFASNQYFLSILEKILNIKFIIFLSDAIKENDINSILLFLILKKINDVSFACTFICIKDYR